MIYDVIVMREIKRSLINGHIIISYIIAWYIKRIKQFIEINIHSYCFDYQIDTSMMVILIKVFVYYYSFK